MVYKTLEELPERIRNQMDPHEQEVYREAFNCAWDDYRRPEVRRLIPSRKVVAHRVACWAVRNKFEKDQKTGRWSQNR